MKYFADTLSTFLTNFYIDPTFGDFVKQKIIRDEDFCNKKKVMYKTETEFSERFFDKMFCKLLKIKMKGSEGTFDKQYSYLAEALMLNKIRSLLN